MSKLPFLLAAIIPLALRSQNYQTVNSGRTALFSGVGTKAIRIDSVHVAGDSVLYPFTTIQQHDFNCFSVDQASWIGPKIIVRKNGHNLFINRNNDTILINTWAEVNESWVAFQPAEGHKIVATVTAKEKLTFLGLEDSVKTIGFHAYDGNNQPVNHSINEKTIQISKEFGFKQVMNFYLFPDLESPEMDETLMSMEMVGMTNPEVGLQNFNWFDVYDFEPGDELHILSTFYYLDIGAGSATETITQNKITYLQRSNVNESIHYRYNDEMGITSTTDGIQSYSYANEQKMQYIDPNPEFDKLPEEVAYAGWAYSYDLPDSNTKIDKTATLAVQEFSENCWGIVMFGGCESDQVYLKGLGGPYRSCSNLPFMSVESSLVYYKKGNTTWGTPLTILGIDEVDKMAEIEVYPNPAKDILYIKNVTPDSNFEILDITGKTVDRGSLSSASTISVQHLGKGIYFLTVNNGNGKSKTCRFVK